MALNLGTASTALHPRPLISSKISKHRNALKLLETPNPSCLKAAALSEGTESRVTEEDPPTYSGYESDGTYRPTIREQLANLVPDRDDDFSIPLGKNLKKVTAKFLTISQKRNIRRQAYLNEVSKRNDSVFFATIGAFVLLPPLVILGIAIATADTCFSLWFIEVLKESSYTN
ncbi:hypothetical protein Sango_2593800 [Sesamum angolense]|uniref:Uncharacterized protein n=1 Tax=Sesamum angolense TaxID=2727404 RepID=A0AAE1W5N5_9LAMI|nr:hypothetical protein Sango_2593800 [Sesamum angolense]